jgi:hypothetical protein
MKLFDGNLGNEPDGYATLKKQFGELGWNDRLKNNKQSGMSRADAGNKLIQFEAGVMDKVVTLESPSASESLADRIRTVNAS